MKTKVQIIKYTSQCRFSDEDWQKVLDYCRERFGGGRIHKSLKPLSESTYQQFLDWIDNGYGVGDVVRYGHTIGILGAYTPDYAYLAVYFSFERQLIEQKLEIPGYKIIKATDNNKAEIEQVLRSMDMKFSVSLACLMKTYQPDNGDIVRITIKNIQTTAIYRSKDDVKLYFYAYVQNGNILKDYSIIKENAIVSKPTKTDVERLQVALAKNQMEWSTRHKVLNLVENARVTKGGRYWYLSETFSICSDMDMYTKKHDERHKNGNYFCAYGAAILFAQKVKSIRKEIAGMK